MAFIFKELTQQKTKQIEFIKKMRILKKNFKKWGEGFVSLIPTDDEDLWHIYNLIQKGDHIQMKTKRKIVDEKNVTGLKKVTKKLITLTLLIVDIDYFAEGDRLAISVKGRNAKQNDYLKIGQFHTFCIELDLKLTIYKEQWTQFQINLIYQISNVSFGVEIAAMVMDEGIAHLCYVKPSITLLKQKIEKNVSKKSSGEQVYKKSIGKFFNQCYLAIKSLNFDKVKCLVIASPGFVNEQFMKYIKAQIESENDKLFVKSLEKIILVKCSTGFMGSLNEVLSDPTVMSKMQNTKAINQTKILEKFYDVMTKFENKVSYGEKEVLRCLELKAIETLLISDHLFRTKDFKKRRVYNDLVDAVKRMKGQAVVFSSLHPSGEKLKNITGIAAILRYEVPPLDDEDEEEEMVQKQEKKALEEDEGAEMPAFNFGQISGDGSNSESEDEMEEKEQN